MNLLSRANRAIDALMTNVLAADRNLPVELAGAMRYAVFPGGGRLRPRLCLAVAASCGEDMPALSDMAAAAIECLHCASLVHDDLPCFDNAATRRGKPSVHRAYGEHRAVLTGDALILLAFQALAREPRMAPERRVEIMAILCRAAGMPSGMVAGQGRELENDADWLYCHSAKTAALFAAATMAGAAAAGAPASPWREVGYLLGRAYQIGDDIRDVCGSSIALGKPAGQDLVHDRPNAVQALGLAGATETMNLLFRDAMAAVPHCAGAHSLRRFLAFEAENFLTQIMSLSDHEGIAAGH